MQVQVNTGDGLTGKETLESWATDFVKESLSRYAGEITRVEVQFTDEAKGKQNGHDMHCMLEAKATGQPPVAVHHNAEDMDQAARGAMQKLLRALDHKFGKLDRHDHRARDTIRRDPEAADAAGSGSTS